jgi:hypothetical protein
MEPAAHFFGHARGCLAARRQQEQRRANQAENQPLPAYAGFGATRKFSQNRNPCVKGDS